MKLALASLATILALSLPAQAQTFSFGFQSPDGFGFSFGNQQLVEQWPTQRPDRPRPDRPRPPVIDYCMHPRAVVEFVRMQGYRDVRLFDDGGRWVRVRAEQRGRSYIVSVDPCRARIVAVDPIRERPWGWGHRY